MPLLQHRVVHLIPARGKGYKRRRFEQRSLLRKDIAEILYLVVFTFEEVKTKAHFKVLLFISKYYFKYQVQLNTIKDKRYKISV